MVLELHVWGPAFSLPSIDAQCLATIAYFTQAVPKGQWVLVASSDPALSPTSRYASLAMHYSTALINLLISKMIANAVSSPQKNYRHSVMARSGSVGSETFSTTSASSPMANGIWTASSSTRKRGIA